MKKHLSRSISMILALVMLFSVSMNLAVIQAATGTGYGSNGLFLAPIAVPNPAAIAIYTAADLDGIRNNLAGSYVLMNDIDLSSYNGGEWTPIADYSTTTFTGTFDGQGHVISNMKITASNDGSFYGLFGYVDNSGTIINLVFHPSSN